MGLVKGQEYNDVTAVNLRTYGASTKTGRGCPVSKSLRRGYYGCTNMACTSATGQTERLLSLEVRLVNSLQSTLASPCKSPAVTCQFPAATLCTPQALVCRTQGRGGGAGV